MPTFTSIHGHNTSFYQVVIPVHHHLDMQMRAEEKTQSSGRFFLGGFISFHKRRLVTSPKFELHDKLTNINILKALGTFEMVLANC